MNGVGDGFLECELVPFEICELITFVACEFITVSTLNRFLILAPLTFRKSVCVLLPARIWVYLFAIEISEGLQCELPFKHSVGGLL